MADRWVQRRSIVLLLPTDESTADGIASAVANWAKINYKLASRQVECHKKEIHIKNYQEVDEK